MSKPTLYIMVGISGSGKSSVAAEMQKNNQNTVIVSSDALREELFGDYEDQDHNKEVFKEFHRRIRVNLLNNMNVIADATNLTMKSRRVILNNISDLDVYKICYIIAKPEFWCILDNFCREHVVPTEVIDRQIKRFQIPFYEEGFNEIKILRNKDPLVLNGQIPDNLYFGKNMLFRLMVNFNQNSPYHIYTLDKHCLLAYQLFEKSIDAKYHKNKAFKLGSKLHDLGKVYTKENDDKGISHFYNHSEYGSYYLLSQLKFPDGWTDDDLLDCCFLVNYHMLPFGWKTNKTKQRWKERFGEYKYNLLIDFHKCDMEAADGEK